MPPPRRRRQRLRFFAFYAADAATYADDAIARHAFRATLYFISLLPPRYTLYYFRRLLFEIRRLLLMPLMPPFTLFF